MAARRQATVATSKKGLTDDFNFRVTKQCRPLFIERVIPSHILPYLSCLGQIDEDRILAKEKLDGATLAADLLFCFLIKRQNWFQDVVQALRQPGIGLADLADTFESFILTIPVRWGIRSFEDSFGHVNFISDPVDMLDIDLFSCLDSRKSGIDEKNTEQASKHGIIVTGSSDSQNTVEVRTSYETAKDTIKYEPAVASTSSMSEKEMHVSRFTDNDEVNVSKLTEIGENSETDFQDEDSKDHALDDGHSKPKPTNKSSDKTREKECCIDSETAEIHVQERQASANTETFKTEQLQNTTLNVSNPLTDSDSPFQNTTTCGHGNTKHKTLALKDEEPSRDKPTLEKACSDNPVQRKQSNEKTLSKSEELKEHENHVRLRIIDKIFSFVKEAQDIPIALKYMKEANLCITGIATGSILINIQVKSMLDLEQILSLCRFGGLKKLLDKDILSNEKVKVLQEMAETEENYAVKNITSHVTIHKEDIERCKAWLIRKETEQVHLLDGLVLSKQVGGTQKSLQISKYVRNHLPECLRRMAEDPFLMDKLDTFYKQEELLNKMELETSQGTLTVTKAVALLFLDWFEHEMTNYLRQLGREMMVYVIQMSCVVFLLMKGQNTNVIPIPVQKQKLKELVSSFQPNITSLSDDGNAIVFKIDNSLARITRKRSSGQPSDMLSYIEVEDQIVIELDEIEVACKLLHSAGILRSDLNGYKFSSDLLRDAVICSILPAACFKETANLERFPYLLQLLAYFSNKDTKSVLIPSKDLKSKHDFRVVQIVMYQRYISGAWDKSAFHVSDIFCLKSKGIGCDIHMEGEAKEMARVEAVTKVSRDVYVDMSEETYGSFGDVTIDGSCRMLHALQWLNYMSSVPSFLRHKTPFYWKKMVPREIPMKTEGKPKLLGTEMFAVDDEESKGFNERPRKRIKLGSTSDSDRYSMSADQIEEPTIVDDGTLNDVTVVSLNLSGQRLTGSNVEYLVHYIAVTPALTSLYLRNCNLQEERIIEAFKTGQFENISRLDISDNACIGAGLTETLGFVFIPSLESLNMQNCNLGDCGIGVLATDLMYQKKLTELNVGNNAMTAEGFLELSAVLMTKTGLTSLQIQTNPIEHKGSTILATLLKRLHVLEELNISECGIGDNGIECIAKSLTSKALRRLLIRSNSISVKGMRAFFKTYNRPPLLDELDSSENAIFEIPMGEDIQEPVSTNRADTAEATQTIADFFKSPYSWNQLFLNSCGLGFSSIFQDGQHYKCLRELTYLNLQNNFITNGFAEDLAKCIEIHCSFLVHINLRQNLIGDKGAIELASSFNGKRYLKEVYLDWNRLSDNGADVLVKCCGGLDVFKSLDLSFNSISASTIERLARNILSETSGNTDLETIVGRLLMTNTFVMRKLNGTMFVEAKEH